MSRRSAPWFLLAALILAALVLGYGPARAQLPTDSAFHNSLPSDTLARRPR